MRLRCFRVKENAKKRIDPGKAKGRGGSPAGFENRGKGERRSGGKEESVRANEVRGRERKGRETKPGVGGGIECEGLVVLGGGVVEAVEEEPREMVVGEGRERRGGDERMPELADGGGTEEGGDREVGED